MNRFTWRWHWFWHRRKTLGRVRLVNHTLASLGARKIPEYEPFFLICRTYDIPETMCKMIESLAKYRNCVGFSIGAQGGAKMLMQVHRTARHNGLLMFIRNYRGRS